MKVTRAQLNKIIAEALSTDPPYVYDPYGQMGKRVKNIIDAHPEMSYEEFMKLPPAQRAALEDALDPIEKPEISLQIPDPPKPELDAQSNFIYFPDNPKLQRAYIRYSTAHFHPEYEYHSGRMDKATDLLSDIFSVYGRPEKDKGYKIPTPLQNIDNQLQKRVYIDLIKDIDYMADTIERYKEDPDFAMTFGY